MSYKGSRSFVPRKVGFVSHNLSHNCVSDSGKMGKFFGKASGGLRDLLFIICHLLSYHAALNIDH
jgi:hypothetical protein